MSKAAQPPPRVARVYASLRSAHLERFARMAPADVLYHRTRYDFDESLTPARASLRRSSAAGVLQRLATTGYRVVEINEPLMSSRWIALATQIAVLRVRAVVTRRPVTVVAYCIENADPSRRLADRWHLPHAVARLVTRLVVSVLVRGVDRLAFGTTGAFDCYAAYVARDPLMKRSRLFEALPEPCTCEPAGMTATDRSNRVTFVGAFSERKGIRQLTAAWDTVHARHPSWHLQLIGKGPLTAVVEDWASARADVTVELDPPRARIHQALRESAVLVLPSQRVGTWREQVGLPIVEGLGHGCQIVTTRESGLAGWLADHGHLVTASGDVGALSDALIEALSARRGPAAILADLPRTDRRIEADEWLTSMPDAHPPRRARASSAACS
ncbi:MAG: glycosyl transferase group 1 [Pseudonocardiales bacterium]|nr:glycosyl transferase group 1 [Pseudonocardiales bacterium]